MGLTWAAAWFGAGLALLLVVGMGAADVPFPLFFGLLGFLAGVIFSGVLGIVAGRRRFDQMSLPQFAVWGGVGALLLSGILVLVAGLEADALLLLGPVFALSGATCAAGSLALARTARLHPAKQSGLRNSPAPLVRDSRAEGAGAALRGNRGLEGLGSAGPADVSVRGSPATRRKGPARRPAPPDLINPPHPSPKES
jgi:hypothetical protein